MKDTFEKIGKSLIYHGKHNNRVYIMKLYNDDFDAVIKKSEELCKSNNYTKIFSKTNNEQAELLIKKSYQKEAYIPNFYNGEKDCVFLSKFIDNQRMKSSNQKEINRIIALSKVKTEVKKLSNLENTYSIQILSKDNSQEMANVYKKVFDSYPFPIFDKEYLESTMDDNIEYAGIFYKDKLISIASAEKYKDYKNSEMTDFATLSEYRGKGLALYLLRYLEDKMIEQNYKTLYTIARSISPAMNITFKKAGYIYSGTLINNTNISGNIESMNIWYKNL